MKTLLFLLVFIGCQAVLAVGENDSLLNVLDKTIETHQQYEDVKINKIKQLKELLQQAGSTQNKYQCNANLIHEYETYSYDSAIYYINKNVKLAQEIGSPNLQNEIHLTFASLLASTGRYHEAFDVLDELKRNALSNEQLSTYYNTCIKLNSELEFYNLNNEYARKYKIRKECYRDSLIWLVKKIGARALDIEEARCRDARELDRALVINGIRLKSCKIGTRPFSTVTFQRSLLYEMLGDKSSQIKFLTLSAISDIQSTNKDNISLTRLARLFYEQGEITRAYQYIRFSFDDASFYKSRLRYVQINNILPLITKAYQQKSEAQSSMLYKMIIIISLLAFVLLGSIIFIILQYKKLVLARGELEQMNLKLIEFNSNLTEANNNLNGLNSKLTEANLIKEQYIGEFLETCFNYMEKLEAYRKMVNKHLVNKQITELFNKTESGDKFEEELANFYQYFDRTFLKLYPDFVAQFNKLLILEEQVTPKKVGTLSIELRIFALIRLGITDSATIARLLRYSINTIYNYRVKIKKSSVIPREDFEEMVLRIGVLNG